MNSTGGEGAIATDVLALAGAGASLRSRAAGTAVAALHGPRSNGRVAQLIRFGWHYVQMAIAMMIGMIPLGIVLSALGRPDLDTQAPEAYALAMTVSMLLPMVAWMRILGHDWERTAEMVAAMTVPIVVLAAGSLIGPLPNTAALFGMNILMWVGMLGAMLFRWRDYAQHGHGQATPTKVGA
jgi:hypothetical protein